MTRRRTTATSGIAYRGPRARGVVAVVVATVFGLTVSTFTLLRWTEEDDERRERDRAVGEFVDRLEASFRATEAAMRSVDVLWLERAADMVAGALERARLYDEQQQIALTLQRSLLPERLPSLDDWSLSATYRPAAPSLLVGGDWYDAFVLEDDRLVVTLGDVAGKGMRAAASMGKLRHLLRAYASIDPRPAAVLAHLNAIAVADHRMNMLSTVCVATVDTDGSCTVASAGHPPPLFVSPHAAELVPLRPGPPLGASPNAVFTDTSVSLRGGEALVLYTDGLVERRDEHLDVSFRRLVEAGRMLGPDLDTTDLVQRLVDQANDDIAVIKLQRVAARSSTVPAQASVPPGMTFLLGVTGDDPWDEIRVARRRLRTLLEAQDLSAEAIDDTIQVAGELLANAAVHGEAPIGLAFSSTVGSIRLAVYDGSSMTPKPHDTRERGLSIVTALSTEWGCDLDGGNGKWVWATMPRVPSAAPTSAVPIDAAHR